MEYNKNDFQKMNDKKVLHKVRKHWIVVSLAMLMALGGTAAATHVSANADATTSNSNAQSNTQTPKENQGQSLVKSANNNNASAQNNNQAQLNNNQNGAKQNITSQASQLHQQILSNAVANQQSSKNQLGAQQNAQSNNNNQGNAEQQQSAAPKISSHVNAPKVGANQSANGRNLVGDGLDANANNNKVDATPSQNVRKLALTNPRAARQLGTSANNDSSDSSQFFIHYLDTSQSGKQINEKYTGYYPDPSKSFSIDPYLKDLSNGYELAKTSGKDYYTVNGNNYNQDNDYDTSESTGTHDLDIYVTPIQKPGNGYVRINYLDSSNHNNTVNAIVSSNSDSKVFNYNDLQSYLQTPPAGYLINNYGAKNAGAITVNNSQTPLTDDSTLSMNYGNGQANAIANINIEVTPIQNPNINDAQGLITYENAANGDTYVTSEPFKQTRGNATNLQYYEKYVPNGYKYDSSITPIADSTWQDGDNDIIFVTPDGTNRNIPKAQAGYSFVGFNYVDQSTGKLINQANAMGKSGSSIDTNSYVDKYLPTNYDINNTINSVSAFPSTDGQTSQVTVYVHLDPTVDPNNGQYDPTKAKSTKSMYASTNIEYVNPYGGSNKKTPTLVDKEINLDNEPAGSVIDYGPYIANVPKGWKYAGMGSHETNFNSGVVDPNAPTGIDPNANIIYVQPMYTTAQPINVEYYNQDGELVGTASDSSNTINNFSDDFNQDIDVTDPANNKADKSSVPNGYSVDKNENVNYQVTNVPQTVKVLVTGNPAGNPTTVNHPKANPDGSTAQVPSTINAVAVTMGRKVSDQNGNNPRKISDYVDYVQNPVVGQHITLSDNEVAPLGYSADSNQPSVTYEIELEKNGNGTQTVAKPIALNGQAIGNQQVPSIYNYRFVPANPDSQGNKPGNSDGKGGTTPNPNYNTPATKKDGKPNNNYPYDALVKPITVQFVNQKGNIVPDHDGQMKYTLNGHYGQQVNVVTDNGTNEMPQGYELNMQNGNVFYTFTDDPQTANVLVTGNTINDNQGNPGATPTNNKAPQGAKDPSGNDLSGKTLTNNQILLHRVMHSYAGDQSDYQVVPMNGQVGDTYTIDPLTNQPKDYSMTPNYAGDQDYSALINSNGSLTVKDSKGQTVNGQEITYDYTDNYGSMNIVYKDGNGNIVKTDKATGQLGSPFDTSFYDNNDLPAGYTHSIDSYSSLHPTTNEPGGVGDPSTFDDSTNGATVTINVNKEDKMSVNYYDVTAGGYKKLDGTKYETGADGNSYNMPASDTALVPAGYTFANDYSGHGMTNGIEKPAQWTDNGTVNVAVTKDPDTPINTDLGSITVHYINAYNNQEVDHVTLNSDVDTNFTLSNYKGTNFMENVPYGYKFSGTKNANVSKFLKGNQDVDVYVNRLPKNSPNANIPSYSTINVEYDDVKTGAKVGKDITTTGKTGTQVPYSQYESVLPQGYKFAGTGYVTNNFEPNVTEHILVAKPAPAYGTVTVNYINDDNGKQMQSDQIVANGKNGSSFDMSNYENSLPQGYKFDSATTSANQNGFIDYFNGSNQTLNIHVSKIPAVHNYSTIHVIYRDANNPLNHPGDNSYANKPHMPDIKENETGHVGDTFDLTNFEHNCPEGGHYAGISQSTPVPSIFPHFGANDTSATEDTPNTVVLLVNY